MIDCKGSPDAQREPRRALSERLSAKGWPDLDAPYCFSKVKLE